MRVLANVQVIGFEFELTPSSSNYIRHVQIFVDVLINESSQDTLLVYYCDELLLQGTCKISHLSYLPHTSNSHPMVDKMQPPRGPLRQGGPTRRADLLVRSTLNMNCLGLLVMAMPR